MREVEEAVQKDIDDAYQALMSKLEESRMRLSQEASASLQEKMKLHLSQKANVETVLAKMKSCKLKEEEESLSQAKSVKADEFKCEMQADMKQVKVSELLPTQKLNIMFTLNAYLPVVRLVKSVARSYPILCQLIFPLVYW